MSTEVRNFPTWVLQARTTYKAAKQAASNASEEVGHIYSGSHNGEGSLLRDQRAKIRLNFYGFIGKVGTNLPDTIELHRGKLPDPAPSVPSPSLGGFTLPGTMTINREVATQVKFYLPRTNEIYIYSPENLKFTRKWEKPEGSFDPAAPDFVGVEALKKADHGAVWIEPVESARRSFNRDWLTGQEINKVLSTAEDTLVGTDKEELKVFQAQLDSLWEETTDRLSSAMLMQGQHLQRSLLDLRDVIANNNPLARRLMRDRFEAGRSSTRGEDGISHEVGAYFFHPQKGKLMLAPIVGRKGWFGRVSQKPDLNSLEEVGPEYWLRDFVFSAVSRKLVEDYVSTKYHNVIRYGEGLSEGRSY